MKPVQVILHPTDFSVNADVALSVADSLARHHGARLVVVHVSPLQKDGATAEEVQSEATICRDALEEIRGRMECDELATPVEVESKMGNIAEKIIETAVRLPADLIVIGAEGCSAFRKALMGSVTEAVMRGASCPVLTVTLPRLAQVPGSGVVPTADVRT